MQTAKQWWVNSHIPKFRLEFSTPKNLWIGHKAVTQHITTGVVHSQKLLGCCHRSHSLLADPSLATYSRDSQLLYRGHCIPKEVFWADQIQPTFMRLIFRNLPDLICTLFPFPVPLQTATCSHACHVVGLVEAGCSWVVGWVVGHRSPRRPGLPLDIPDLRQLFLQGARSWCMQEFSLAATFTQV